MAISKPTYLLSGSKDFLSNLNQINDLTYRLRLYPFRLKTLAPPVCLPSNYTYLLSEFGSREYNHDRKPTLESVLYQISNFYLTLYLNRFRKEPAISKLD